MQEKGAGEEGNKTHERSSAREKTLDGSGEGGRANGMRGRGRKGDGPEVGTPKSRGRADTKSTVVATDSLELPRCQ